MTSIIKLANLFLLLVACEIVSSENIRTGFNKFVSYYVGNMNLIITAPHGGYLKVGSPPCSVTLYHFTYVHMYTIYSFITHPIHIFILYICIHQYNIYSSIKNPYPPTYVQHIFLHPNPLYRPTCIHDICICHVHVQHIFLH